MQRKWIFILCSFSIFTIAMSFGSVSDQSWVIDGDRVYINDNNVFLQAKPHTLYSSGWVYFNLTSKVYAGDIDVVWGFDIGTARPTKAELYSPRDVNTTKSYTCTGDYFNYTWDYNGSPDNHFWCWDVATENDTYTLLHDGWFEWGDIPQCTAFWNEAVHYDWTDVSGKFESISYTIGGMDKWYYVKDVPIVQGRNYQMRAYINIPITLGGAKGKYWFAIKPSGESIQQAVQNGHLYYIDPWFESYDYRYEILSNATVDGMPFSVNDIDLVGGSPYWTANASKDEDIYVYCVNSGCASGAVAIANGTYDEKNWEKESDGGNNVVSLWADDDYIGVWHGPAAMDSVGNFTNGTYQNGVANVTNGIFGDAWKFDSDAGGYWLDWGDDTDAEFAADSSFSWEFWINCTTKGTDGDSFLLSKGWGRYGASTRPLYYTFLKDGTGYIECGTYSSSENQRDALGTTDVCDSAWHYILCLVNGTNNTVSTWVDAEMEMMRENIEEDEAWGTNTQELIFGKENEDRNAVFYVDELKLSNVARGPNYVKQQYYNGLGNLTTLGAEDQAAPPTNGPQFSSNQTSIASGTAYDGTSDYDFSITWTTPNDWVNFEHNFTGSATNVTTNSLTNTSGTYNYTTHAHEFNGAYTYYYRWYSSNGTGNQTEQINYVITQGPTTLHVAINGTESDQTIIYPATSNVTAWKDVTGGTLTLMRNGTAVSNPEEIGLAAYKYNYTANMTHENYTATQVDRLLTIDKAGSTIALELNDTRGDKSLDDGSVKFEAYMVTPDTAETVYIYDDEVPIGSGASHLTQSNSSWRIGTHTVMANWTGNENYTTDSESWTLAIRGINVTDVRDTETDEQLTANITIYDDSHSFTVQDVSIQSNYSSELWDTSTAIKVSSDGYANRYYTSDQPEVKSFTAYLIASGGGSYIRFNILTSGGIPISDATVTAEQFVDDEWVTVEEKETDDSGIARLFLDPLTSYHITAEASGYDSQTKSITPSAEDYYFYLASQTNVTYHTLFEDVEYSFTPTDPTVVPNTTYTFNYVISCSNSTLEWYSMNITYNDTTAIFFSNVTTHPEGGNITHSMNVSYGSGNYSIVIRLKKQAWGEWNASYTYHIRDITPGELSVYSVLTWLGTSGMNPFFLNIIAIFISFLAAGLASKANMPGGGALAFIVLIIFTALGWFSWQVMILTGMTLAAVLLLKGRI